MEAPGNGLLTVIELQSHASGRKTEQAISELPFVSVSKRVQVRNLSYENEFDLHLNELVIKTHFRTWTRFETEVNGTRKWPIGLKHEHQRTSPVASVA